MNSNGLLMTTVRKLVQEYALEELCRCVNEQVNQASNSCFYDKNSDDMLNALAKASFVKQLMTQGMQSDEAIRELGKRMRALSGK